MTHRGAPAPRPGLVCLAVLALVLGCGGQTAHFNVVIVSVDTLRADRLGSYGNDEWGTSPSPELDALAARSVLFERAYAPRGQTHPSLASMLTGKYPATHGLRENGQQLPIEHVTLFERLQRADFRTGVFVANLQVTHPTESWAARGAHVSADGYAGRWQQESRQQSRYQKVWDDRIEAAGLRFLDGVDRGRPFALWMHFYDVHRPYTPPEEHLLSYGVSEDVPAPLAAPGPGSDAELDRHIAGITLTQRPVPEAELRRIRGLYDGAVATTDARLGRLLDKLDELGELERSFVIFTADHGEELYDHNRYFYHGSSIYEGVVRIPLVIWGPDLERGLRMEAHVQNIDIAPTVLDLVGLVPDPDMEGHSLAPLLRGDSHDPPAAYAFVEWQNLITAVTDGRWKVIWNPGHVWTRKQPFSDAPPEAGLGFRVECIEAYDLAADPRERNNLLAGFDLASLDTSTGEGLPPHLQPLFRALQAWLLDPRHRRELDAGFSEEEIERLARMGYLAPVDRPSGRRVDILVREPCVGP